MASFTSAILIEVENPKALIDVAKDIRDAGYKKFDVYSPFPIHGMDDAMGLKRTKLAWISLVGGLFGLTLGLSLQSWTSAIAYKIQVSGKPFLSLPAFIPVTFELSILFTAFFTVFGMFALNQLPMWNHKVFNSTNFQSATSHGFFLSIDADDPLFELEKTISFVNNCNIQSIEIIKETK